MNKKLGEFYHVQLYSRDLPQPPSQLGDQVYSRFNFQPHLILLTQIALKLSSQLKEEIQTLKQEEV
jgi:hypothetical protein